MGSIEGIIVSDDISLTKSTKYQAKEVNFISVNKASDLGTLEADGLLGLGP